MIQSVPRWLKVLGGVAASVYLIYVTLFLALFCGALLFIGWIFFSLLVAA